MQVALHVVLITQPGRMAPEAATAASDTKTAAQCRLLRPLALDCLATAELVWESNWVRPSISSLSQQQRTAESIDSRNSNSNSSSSPSASIIDLLFAPPYISVADACAENIAGRLAVLLLRYIKQQHQHHHGIDLLQELRAGAADFANAVGLKARAAAILAAAKASGSENFQVSKRAATAVLCELLSNDIIFSALPAEQRLPELLARSKICSMEAVAAALCQPYTARQHWEVCANCGLPAETLAELGLQRRLLRCEFCVTCVCISCFREKMAASDDGGAATDTVYSHWPAGGLFELTRQSRPFCDGIITRVPNYHACV
jgi:hypothetical protein